MGAAGLRCVRIAAVAAAAVFALAAGVARAGEIDLQRPGDREFVLDRADVLGPVAESEVAATCDTLLTETAIPIVVVTIRRMQDHGWHGGSIEAFARELYDQWGIGHAVIEGRPWNRGVLLLVAVDDRKARIELGAGYSRSRDDDCKQVMERVLVPAFREGHYDRGIAEGVEALAGMVRGKAPPSAPPSVFGIVCFGGFGLFVALFMLTAIPFRQASGGRSRAVRVMAWVCALIDRLMAPQRWAPLSFDSDDRHSFMSGGGGGFSGGSFGGGFSGGGGATGSW